MDRGDKCMIKLLESIYTEENDVSQQIQDGALMNYQTCDQRDGYIFGCKLSCANKTITMSKGLFIIRGFRFDVETDTTILDLSATTLPSTSTIFYLFIRVIVRANNATWSIRYSASSNKLTAPIEQTDGTNEYLIATFTASSNGISVVTNKMGRISASSPSTTSSVGSSIPMPVIELVTTRTRGKYYGHLALANKYDYQKYIDKYTVNLVFHRYFKSGRYAKEAGASHRFRFHKSGFVRTIQTQGSNIGWNGSVLFKLNQSLNDLKKITIDELNGAKFVRNDIIDSMENYVKSIFYDPCQTYSSTLDCMIPDKQRKEVTIESNPFFIRCTRSKKGWNGKKSCENWKGLYGKTPKNNEFRFAYSIEIRDANNKVIAESPLSIPISIKPNHLIKVEKGDYSGRQYVDDIGQLFRINVG